MTVSSELTTSGGASPVDDNEEEGLVLDQATLVLGDEDPNEEDVLETSLAKRPLSSGIRTPTKMMSGKPATP